MFQSGWWKIKIQPSATLIGGCERGNLPTSLVSFKKNYSFCNFHSWDFHMSQISPISRALLRYTTQVTFTSPGLWKEETTMWQQLPKLNQKNGNLVVEYEVILLHPFHQFTERFPRCLGFTKMKSSVSDFNNLTVFKFFHEMHQI